MVLPPEASRIIYARNLPYAISPADLYDTFGRFGTIQQIRLGKQADTKGSCFVIYDDVEDAVDAVNNLSGFNVGGRYLIVLFYNPKTIREKMKRQQTMDEVKRYRENGEKTT